MEQPLYQPTLDIFTVGPIQDSIFRTSNEFSSTELGRLCLVNQTWASMIRPYWFELVTVGRSSIDSSSSSGDSDGGTTASGDIDHRTVHYFDQDFFSAIRYRSWIRHVQIQDLKTFHQFLNPQIKFLKSIHIFIQPGKFRTSSIGKLVTKLVHQNPILENFSYICRPTKKTIPFSILCHGLETNPMGLRLKQLRLERVHFEDETLGKVLKMTVNLEEFWVEDCRYLPWMLKSLNENQDLGGLKKVVWRNCRDKTGYANIDMKPLRDLIRVVGCRLEYLEFKACGDLPMTDEVLNEILSEAATVAVRAAATVTETATISLPTHLSLPSQSTVSISPCLSTFLNVSTLVLDFNYSSSHSYYLNQMLGTLSPLTDLRVKNLHMDEASLSILSTRHGETLTSLEIGQHIRPVHQFCFGFGQLAQQLPKLKKLIKEGQEYWRWVQNDLAKELSLNRNVGNWWSNLEYFELKHDKVVHVGRWYPEWKSYNNRVTMSFHTLTLVLLPLISTCLKLKNFKLQVIKVAGKETEKSRKELLNAWKLLKSCQELTEIEVLWSGTPLFCKKVQDWSEMTWPKAKISIGSIA